MFETRILAGKSESDSFDRHFLFTGCSSQKSDKMQILDRNQSTEYARC